MTFQNFSTWLILACCLLQTPTAAQVPNIAADPNGTVVTRDAATPPIASSNGDSIVLDPLTGRWYSQQLVAVPVAGTKWESKPVTQWVYETKLVTTYQPAQENLFVPKTEYFWKVRARGRLNPFRQTTYTHEYAPMTHWVAAKNTTTVPITTRSWTARLQTTCVYQPVQSTEIKQRLVQTEMRPPRGSLPVTGLPSSGMTPIVSQPRDLANLQLLVRKNQWATEMPGRGTPVTASPMRSAYPPDQDVAESSQLRTAARDSVQSGMSATVLR